MRDVPIQPNLRSEAVEPLSTRFWAMLVVTGLLAGLVGGLLMHLLFAVERVSFHYTTGGFLDGVRATSSLWRITILTAAGLIAGGMGLVASRMRGSTDLDGSLWMRAGRLPVVKSSVRAVYSIVVVGMGAAVGRENALKQAGAVLANLAASWRNLNDDERRLLVACGGGAGMAAAYNVPLGGAFFVLEVLLGSFTIRAALPALTASVLATWASWLLLPNRATYVFPVAKTPISLIVWAALAGPLCGLASVAFIRLLAWGKAGKPCGWQAFALPVVSLAALGVVATRVPEMLGNGKDVVDLTLLNAPLTGTLVALLLLRPLATACILRAGVPGGLFTPALSAGAVTGLLLGRGWAALLPGTVLADQLPSCALIGAAAVLAAATQGPLSAVVFALELTRTADAAMVPLLIAVVSATLTARLLEQRSIYSIEVDHGSHAPASEEASQAAKA